MKNVGLRRKVSASSTHYKYSTDIDALSYQILGYNEPITAESEKKAVIELFNADLAYLKALLSGPHQEELVSLFRSMDAESQHYDLVETIDAFVEKQDVEAFYRVIRITDVGRDWMEEAAKVVASFKGPPKWKTSVKKTRAESIRLRNQFISTNLRLVIAMTSSFSPHGSTLRADLIQEGNLGLMKAVDKFEHERGWRFSTYAGWWIRQSINKAKEYKLSQVRIPSHIVTNVKKIWRLQREQKRDLSVAEIVKIGNMKEHDVLIALENQRLLVHARAYVSTSEPLPGSDKLTVADSLVYEDETPLDEVFESNEKTDEVAELLKVLDPREYKIITQRFGIHCDEVTLKEIGDQYGLSRERIRQVEMQAIRKLRHQAIKRDLEKGSIECLLKKSTEETSPLRRGRLGSPSSTAPRYSSVKPHFSRSSVPTSQ